MTGFTYLGHAAFAVGGGGQYSLYKCRLGIGVSGAIAAKLLSKRTFEVRVGAYGIRLCTQGVSKDEVPRELRTVVRTDVEVMTWLAGRGGEGFSAGDAEVTLRVVTQWAQVADHRGQVRPAADDYVEVDNGLGCQAGDRRAADMLDPCREGTEAGRDLVTEPRKYPWPLGVVINDLHRCSHTG